MDLSSEAETVEGIRKLVKGEYNFRMWDARQVSLESDI